MEKLADGGAIAVNDDDGMVNGSHSLIKTLKVKVNGIQVYDNTMANQAVSIKSLLEYDESYFLFKYH